VDECKLLVTCGVWRPCHRVERQVEEKLAALISWLQKQQESMAPGGEIQAGGY
jgi:hypothetical protein